jgi:YtkA-like
LAAGADRGFKSPVLQNVGLQYRVVISEGQPEKDADFEVLAEHADMSNMTVHLRAVDPGDGLYTVTPQFSMPGIWKVIFKVKKDSLEHRQDIILKTI